MRTLSTLALAALLTMTRAGLAETPSSEVAVKASVAQRLRAQAEALVRDGNLDKAAAMFEESVRFESSPEALLALGDVYERTGATASAWGAFHRAEIESRGRGDAPHAVDAARRARSVEAKLARVKIVVTPSEPSPSVELDGREVEASAWDTGIPVDPGLHKVTATARGRLPFSYELTTPSEGTTKVVVVPPLEVPPQPASPRTPRAPEALDVRPPPSPQERASSDPRREGARMEVAGLTLMSIGFAGAGMAVATYIAGRSGADINLPTGLGLILGGAGGGAVFVLAGYCLDRAGERRKLQALTRLPLRVAPVVGSRAGGVALQATW